MTTQTPLDDDCGDDAAGLTCAGSVGHSVGGVELGSGVRRGKQMIHMSSARPLRFVLSCSGPSARLHTSTPNVQSAYGAPDCGTRVLGMLAAGDSVENLLSEYPWLEPDDVRACLLYTHRRLGHRVTGSGALPVPSGEASGRVRVPVPELPAFPPLDEETVAVADQNASWSKWARLPRPGAAGKKTIGTFDEMCQDLTPPKADGDRSSLLHEVAYYHASMWVHSAPPSIQEIFSDFVGMHILEIAPRQTLKLAGLAVHVSNAALWFALKAFDEWAGTQQGDELDAIKADLERRPDSSD